MPDDLKSRSSECSPRRLAKKIESCIYRWENTKEIHAVGSMEMIRVFAREKGRGWRVEDRWPYSQPEGIRSLITERGGILISSVCSSQTHRPIRLSSRAVIRYMYTSARFQSKNSGRTLLTVLAIGSTTSLLSEVNPLCEAAAFEPQGRGNSRYFVADFFPSTELKISFSLRSEKWKISYVDCGSYGFFEKREKFDILKFRIKGNLNKWDRRWESH